MTSEKELHDKYPQPIIDLYFDYGTMINWDDEYFDIAWKYPFICLVIVDLHKYNMVVDNIDVMIKGEVFALEYEGSNWNEEVHFPKEIHNIAIDNLQSTINVFSALKYLHSFFESNINTIQNFDFKLSFRQM